MQTLGWVQIKKFKLGYLALTEATFKDRSVSFLCNYGWHINYMAHMVVRVMHDR